MTPGWETSVSGLVGRDLVDGAWRSKAGGGLGLYGPGGRNATMDATLYQPIINRLSERWGVAFGIKTPDHFPAGFGLSYVRSKGGNFFGLPRQDDTYRLSVDLQLGKRAFASVGFTRKNSTVEFYDVSGEIDIRLFVLESRP
ncbi:MAG: hypothetical protein CFE32_05570 [Alphaproteobacteria bacterium PA3]|nr:MAG: hypothetical protein CFE32_05570 [Alphaproteobacteria bacterium PA3]